ncbi:peptidyl-tRNA hydrolase PTH2-domain-containing protein [Gongronella butleri]|nr:peptidyl-tRNA hydrolase PTH2-domain-containing protein [Gongronella butleri]
MHKLTDSIDWLHVATASFVALLSGVYLGHKLAVGGAHADEDEDEMDQLAEGAIDVNKYQDYKMVLVVRTDLGMTKGKIAAQCGHATLACYKAILKSHPEVLKRWERSGQAKVALKAASEDEILELQAKALSLNLTAQSICDAGRTQIAAGSRTVLGLGPGPVELINEVSGHLKLL